MRLRSEFTYDAPPEDVFAMVADPAFREQVGTAQGVISADVTLTRTGAGFTLVNDQVQNSAGLPAIAKKIAGDTSQAIVREEWADATGGTVEITTPGKPASASGSSSTAALRPRSPAANPRIHVRYASALVAPPPEYEPQSRTGML